MDKPLSRLIVVGDRVLIRPEGGEERTRAGLYLPQSAIDKHAVQGGRVIALGPGTPMPEPASIEDEPWKVEKREARYVPMQARLGDFALFFKAAAVEITFEGKNYLIVAHSSILVLIRDPEEGHEVP